MRVTLKLEWEGNTSFSELDFTPEDMKDREKTINDLSIAWTAVCNHYKTVEKQRCSMS